MTVKKKVPLFQPLRHRQFRYLFIANFASNVGTWMQTFAAAWLVASQSNDPATATLIQAATYLPIFLFAFFGGALADRMDRSKYLLFVNAQMAVSALWLGWVALRAAPSLAAVLALTFLIGAGAAFKVAAWQSSMSELIEPYEIEAAATLHGLSYNLASIIGPLFGAWLFSRTGAATLFFVNALSFIGLMALYLGAGRVARAPTPAPAAENYLRSLGLGIRTCFQARDFRAILALTLALFFSISAFNALLPIFVKTVLAAHEELLGGLMALFGAGAVGAAFALPHLRPLLERDHLLAAAAIVFGAMLCAFGATARVALLAPAAVLAGFVWAAIVSTMNSMAVAVFAPAMRARALAIYSMAFSGALILGSFGWGKLASTFGIGLAYRAAGIGIALVAIALLAGGFKVAGAAPRPRSTP